MISKELLSEVLGVEVNIFDVDKKNDLVFEYKNDGTYGDTDIKINKDFIGTYINIYELAHKCKEWANSIGYKMESGTNCLIGYSASTCRSMTDDGWTVFQSDTEPEAIFKACEWILRRENN